MDLCLPYLLFHFHRISSERKHLQSPPAWVVLPGAIWVAPADTALQGEKASGSGDSKTAGNLNTLLRRFVWLNLRNSKTLRQLGLWGRYSPIHSYFKHENTRFEPEILWKISYGSLCKPSELSIMITASSAYPRLLINLAFTLIQFSASSIMF